MAGNVRFVPNPGFEEALLRSTWLKGELEPVAASAERIAKSIAPERTGHYVESIEAKVIYSAEHEALIVHLASSDFKAWWIEAGTVDTHASPTLVPAMEQAAPGARWGAP